MSAKRPKPAPAPKVASRPSNEQVEQLVHDEHESSSGELVPVGLEVLPVEAPLPCGIYLKVAGRYILFRNAGERLSGDRLMSLQEKGASTIYVHKSSWKLFLESLEASPPSEPVSPLQRAEYIRSLLMVYGQELEKRMKVPKKGALDPLKNLCGQLADTLAKHPAVGAKLIRRHRDPVLYFVEHAINVAIYATLIGRKVGVAGENLRHLTFGALVHDVGFLQVPKHIAHSPNPLTQAQEEQYRAHSKLGGEALQVTGVSPLVIACAIQHHEREDGNGYPSRTPGHKLHLHAKIVSIADTFDDLVGPHPGRKPMSPLDAAEAMRRMRGRFDPKLMDLVGADSEEKAA
jgi:hypothetical protein